MNNQMDKYVTGWIGGLTILVNRKIEGDWMHRALEKKVSFTDGWRSIQKLL